MALKPNAMSMMFFLFAPSTSGGFVKFKVAPPLSLPSATQPA
jgi:hypothetical protein